MFLGDLAGSLSSSAVLASSPQRRPLLDGTSKARPLLWQKRQPSITTGPLAARSFQLAVSKMSVPLLVAGACLARRAGGRRDTAIGRAAASKPSVSPSTAEITERQSLERAAALLRAEAAEFEAERRRRQFSEFDANKSGGVDITELQRGMKECFAMDLDEGTAVHLLSLFDKNVSGELEFEEFDLKRLRSAALARSREVEEKARRRAEKEKEADENIAYWRPETLPGENQDNGPLLLPIAAPLYELYEQLEGIPFGSLIAFLVLQYLSRQQWVPALLRYNLCQAVDLDVRICLFGLFLQLAPFLAGAFVPLTQESIEAGMINTYPTNAAIICNVLGIFMGTLLFLPFIASIIYSIALSMLGFVPRSIPMVSQEADRIMGLPMQTGREKDDDTDAKSQQ